MSEDLITVTDFLSLDPKERDRLYRHMIHQTDQHFLVVLDQLPLEYSWDHSSVTVCLKLSTEDLSLLNQFITLPCAHRELLFSPLKQEVDIESFLKTEQISKVSCSGDSQGQYLCHYDWITSLQKQCIATHTAFRFLSTGTLFEKDGKIYTVPSALQTLQACKAALDYSPRHQAAQRDTSALFARLSRSRFRSSFSLKQKDLDYIDQKGLDVIRQHATDMIAKRLAPAVIDNDGRQTPMRGHPVFIAQHATGTCCRGCLEKWHGIAPGKELTIAQQEYVVSVIMEWIDRQLKQR